MTSVFIENTHGMAGKLSSSQTGEKALKSARSMRPSRSTQVVMVVTQSPSSFPVRTQGQLSLHACVCGRMRLEVLRGCCRLGGPQLHLRHFVAVVIAFPGLPVDAVCKAVMGSPKVVTIQVRHVTGIVPPGPVVQLSTMLRTRVIVLVFGGEGMAIVGRQGVTCSDGKTGYFIHSVKKSWILGPGVRVVHCTTKGAPPMSPGSTCHADKVNLASPHPICPS